MSSPTKAIPWLVTVLRVLVGGTFLYEATNQLAKGWIGGDGLERMLRSALNDHAVLPPYRWFLEEAIIPHAEALTPLIVVGEIATGVALVAGFLTRLTVIVAFCQNLAFLLMNGLTVGGLIDAIFLVFEALIIVWVAQQRLSLDAVLVRRGWQPAWLSGAWTGTG